jgi:ABC-2 type transport system permease protein
VEFINSNGNSAIMGTTFAAYLGIQLLFGLVFFVIGMIVFKKKELYAV